VMTDIGESCCYSIERWLVTERARTLRAVFALMRTCFYSGSEGVHTSVNAARTSACATGGA